MLSCTLDLWLLIGIVAVVKGDIPGCDYFDTVDLTNRPKFENGSYQYEDIIIPKDLVGLYDYKITYLDKIAVPEHIRGCACSIKSCIRFCCHPQQLVEEREAKCREGGAALNYSSILPLTMNDGRELEINAMDFIIQEHLPVPCADYLILNENLNWTLFENGTLLRHLDGASLSKREYCLQPIQSGEGDSYKIFPHHCVSPVERTNAYIQIVSVCFIIMIIVVYLLLPNFKSVHGKCCTTYFICLAVTFLLNITMSFGWIETSDQVGCKLLGYTAYYFVMATFLWLSVIAYNLWKAFVVIGVSRRSCFTYYNIFVWGLAGTFLAIVYCMDLFEGTIFLVPGVGVDSCWINVYVWQSTAIYYYGPILLLLICNVVLFFKTALRIFMQNKKNRRQLKISECQRNLRNLTHFRMFIRLFIIVGVIWILEIISYVCQVFYIHESVIQFCDALTSGQGVILFIATIIKMDVLRSLRQRFRGQKVKSDTSTTSQSTQNTQSTECGLLPKNQPDRSNVQHSSQ